jgi:hypothetical protein
MNYKIGDKVSLVDQCAQAYILQILSNGLIRIELDDDFKTELIVKPLQLAPYKDLSAYNTAKIKPKENKFQKSASTAPKLAQQALTKHTLEVDLHIEKLVKNTRGLSNTEMVEIQLRTVKQVLFENRNKKGLKIVFIHGVGKGVLKMKFSSYLPNNSQLLKS